MKTKKILDKFQKEAYFLFGYIGSKCQVNNHKIKQTTEEDMNWVANRLRKLCDGQKLQLKNGKLPIPYVSQQSELLINFLKYCRTHGETWILEHEIEKLVKDFLKIN